ncbi:hypothetical protein G3480_26970 [Thiorhodococcus mannitoliphagus]|uniref:Uncharacterized protein n=1 Tax=Thiorhodococcus mannitoliphagus TaxID=329406 RepID=A0A6P1E251_9GAMM|nr:hypothetical protein [Thiorhodococcus mannitoliphagus]NEX23850.1 hypothetical protein [Thiorhodococcus mannitoliphagus]
MLAENLENWAKREREEGRLEGQQIGIQKGRLEAAQNTARHLIKLGVLTDGQVAQATGRTVAQVEALRSVESR